MFFVTSILKFYCKYAWFCIRYVPKIKNRLKSRWDTWLNGTLAYPDHKRSAWEGHRLLEAGETIIPGSRVLPPLNTYSGSKDNTTQALANTRVFSNWRFSKAPDISFRDINEVSGWRYPRTHCKYSGGGGIVGRSSELRSSKLRSCDGWRYCMICRE